MQYPTFVAIDLESTGLDDDKDEIIEIALVRFVDGKPSETFDCLVKPSQEVRPFIYSLTGIDPNELAKAKPFADVAKDVLAFIGETPIVAHNANFDARFLKYAFSKVGIAFENHPVYDTLLLSRMVWQNIANHRLETLISALHIPMESAHRALPDAKACGQVFVRGLEEMAKFNAFERHYLALLAKDTFWSSLLPSVPDSATPVMELLPESTPAIASALAPKIPSRIRDFFGNDGLLSKQLPQYQENQVQQMFAEIEERNLFKGGIAVLEAGTGSGKTLAYLVPAIVKAVHSGERVVISTATRTLQEQLWQKDIPSIAPMFGSALKPALVKGRNNYICLRKFEEHLQHAERLLAPEERESMMPLVTWIGHTTSGDVNSNSGFHISRNRQLWNKLASDSSSCVGQSCRFFQQCFGLGARRKAQNANLVLINHALFLQDLSLDFALLPAYEHIVFDEAHRLPQAAHDSFGKRIWFFRFRNQLKMLSHTKNPEQGQLGIIEAWAAKSMTEGFADQVVPLAQKSRNLIVETEKCLHRFFLKIGKNIKRFNDKDGLRYSQSIMDETQSDPKPVLQNLDELQACLEQLGELCTSQTGGTGFAKDLAGSVKEVLSFRKDLDFITHAQKEDWAFWMEEPGNPHTIVLYAQPLEPGKFFAQKFYPWVKSALFTSATLSVQGGLEYFQERMGMPHGHEDSGKRPFARILEQPFDVDANRKIIIADFLPKPNDAAFQGAMDEILGKILPTRDVSSMVLFTSLNSLGKSHQVLAPLFSAAGKTLLSQHTDGAIDNLVEIFRKKKGSCIIGAQSLWEGIDLPGDALEFLVIPKLPFPTPGDALIQARGDMVKRQGGNSFKDIFIPEAVLALRQGLGRLIRSKEDKGTVLLLDPRLIHENYGKSFTRIWNGKHQVVHSVEELIAAIS